MKSLMRVIGYLRRVENYFVGWPEPTEKARKPFRIFVLSVFSIVLFLVFESALLVGLSTFVAMIAWNFTKRMRVRALDEFEPSDYIGLFAFVIPIAAIVAYLVTMASILIFHGQA